MKNSAVTLLITAALATSSALAIEPKEVVNHYADIAQAVYEDAQMTANESGVGS